MVAFDGRTTEAPRMSRPARALVGLRGRARVALAVMPSARLRRGGHPGDPPGPVAPAPAPISPAPGPAAPAAPATLGRSTRQAFREALGNPGIRRIQAAWTLGIAGDQALLVALLVVAYTAGGPVAIAILGIARMAPSIVIAPLAGSVAGRMAPARLLLVTQLVRLGGAAGVALLLVAGGPLPAVLAAAVVLATAGALVRPFQAASMPSFARTPGELVAANVVSSVGEGTGGVVGPVAAGLLVVVAGPPAVAVVATGLIGLAVAALAGMPAPESAAWPARSSRGQEPLHPLAILRGAVLGGPAALRGRPGAQMLAISMTSQTFVRGLLTTLLVVASLQLGLGEGGIGLLTGALGLGTLAGALGASGLAGRRNLGPVFAVSLSAWGFPLAIIGAVPLPAVALAALLVTGVANAILDISGFTLLQRNVDARERVAVFGFLEALIGLGVATGGVVAPVLIAAFGAQGVAGDRRRDPADHGRRHLAADPPGRSRGRRARAAAGPHPRHPDVPRAVDHRDGAARREPRAGPVRGRRHGHARGRAGRLLRDHHRRQRRGQPRRPASQPLRSG